jgi:hypothetical protein
MLTAQTKKNEAVEEDSANFSVFRLKKDVLKSSNVGFIQLAYQKGTARFGERGTQDHTLFLKLTYMF